MIDPPSVLECSKGWNDDVCGNEDSDQLVNQCTLLDNRAVAKILCDCVGYQRDTFAFYESLAIRWVVKAKNNNESKDLSELAFENMTLYDIV